MKKILAMMLTFVLCLSVASLALAEEETAIPELETEVDFEATESYINGTYYVLSDVDDLTSVAYTDYDGEKVITFTLAGADADAVAAYRDTVMKVLGSLSMPADAE